MLVEDRRTDGSDAILHREIVAIVGQCISQGAVVESRHNRTEAAAFCSSHGAYLIESNFLHAYATFCFGIFFVQFIDMKSLKVDWFLLNSGRRRSSQYNWLSVFGNEDDRDDCENRDANCGKTERPRFREKKRQRDQDQYDDP